MKRMSLTLPPLTVQPTPPPLTSSMPHINTLKLQPTPEQPPKSDYHHESDIHEEIPLSLVLPDGVTYKFIVKTGETVQEIKRKLDTTHGIPYSDATLYFNGKCMIDPLSLNDFPGLVCKDGVSLDVKLNSAWSKKDDVQQLFQTPNQTQNQPPPLNGTQHSVQESRKSTAFLDIGTAPQNYSSDFLNSLSFVEYVDAPLSSSDSRMHLDSYDPASPPSSPPSLPNAFSDSPTAGKMNRRKPEEPTKVGSTTIDIKDDDDDPQCKEIHEIGKSSKRWKLCFLF